MTHTLAFARLLVAETAQMLSFITLPAGWRVPREQRLSDTPRRAAAAAGRKA